MSTDVSRPSLNYFRYLVVAILTLASIGIVASTLHWPLTKDAQVIHYINFLMDHGFAPYRNITDMNMPGAYLIEGWGMHLFGGSDLAWRIYDFALMGLLGVAMVVIALPYDWVAGLFAAVLFALVHSADGPGNTGERDEVMAVLIALGYAFLFQAVRRKKPWLMVLFGLSLGMASSVKPTVAPLGVVLLVIVWWTLRRRSEPTAPYIWSGLAGAAIASAIVFTFLLRHNATAAFFEISRRLTPYYASLNHTPLASMVRTSLSPPVLVLLPFALAVAFVHRQWTNWERSALLLGVAFGAFSYFVQRKGYTHHRYTLVAFMLLWIAIELTLAMRRQGWLQAVGFAGITVGALLVTPAYMLRVHRIHPSNHYTESVEHDLAHLGAARLQHNVQCLDLIDGCLNALYHLRIVQTTGSTGDLLFFTPVPSPVAEYYKQQFWDDILRNPPAVMVVSNEWWNDADSFDKLKRWPQFNAYLAQNYTLAVSRNFPTEENHAYRIYIRNGAALPPLPQNAAE